MVEVLFALVVVAFLGAVAGAVAAFTHHVLIVRSIASARADFAKVVNDAKAEYAAAVADLKALKAKL